MHYKKIKNRPNVRHYWFDVKLFTEEYTIEATSYASALDKVMTRVMQNYTIIKRKD